MRWLWKCIGIICLFVINGCIPPFPEYSENITENSAKVFPDGIFWYSGFETANLEEWSPIGGFVKQAPSDYYYLNSSNTHSGNYAVGLRIDTSQPTQTGSHASYLFYWDELPNDSYYYSAWLYIPSEVSPSDWWNIWQWKSTDNGNSDDSLPMYILGVTKILDRLWLYLEYRPDTDRKIKYTQYDINLPKDQWFQIETFYKASASEAGTVIVWEDGTEVFNVTGYPTVLSDNTLYWSVNNYAERIEPEPCTIYVDDVAISSERLGPDYDYTELK